MAWENEIHLWQRNEMQPIFIVGCARSGTTLLGAMLGTHPACLTTPESKFNVEGYQAAVQPNGTVDLAVALTTICNHWNFRFWEVAPDAAELAALSSSRSYGELVKQFVQIYGVRKGKAAPAYWVDHTPYNVLHVPLLFQLYPDARLIHLVRDGRAVAASVMKLDWGPNTVATAAPWWTIRVAHGLAAEAHFGAARVLRVSYEALVREPQANLQKVCDFVGIHWQPDMVSGTGFQVPHYSTRQHGLVGAAPQAARATAWQEELSPRQIEIFENLAGNLLQCLGYEPHYGARARPLTRLEKIVSQSQAMYMTKIVNRLRIQTRVRQALSLMAHAK